MGPDGGRRAPKVKIGSYHRLGIWGLARGWWLGVGGWWLVVGDALRAVTHCFAKKPNFRRRLWGVRREAFGSSNRVAGRFEEPKAEAVGGEGEENWIDGRPDFGGSTLGWEVIPMKSKSTQPSRPLPRSGNYADNRYRREALRILATFRKAKPDKARNGFPMRNTIACSTVERRRVMLSPTPVQLPKP